MHIGKKGDEKDEKERDKKEVWAKEPPAKMCKKGIG